MVDTKITIYSLDDLVVAPEIVKEARVFRKAAVRKDYEIIIPDEESDILLRDLKASPFRRQAERLVKFYLEADAKVDYLSQNKYYQNYFEKHHFNLPWLVPIVKDNKLVFKKKNEGELTVYKDSNALTEIQKNILNYANVDESQILVENLHNYESYTRYPESVSMTNHSGAHVLRVRLPLQEGMPILKNNLQFRGSYGDWKMTQLIERKKTAKKDVITGKNMVDRIVGESIEVVGFAKLPTSYPNAELDLNWFENSEIMVNPEQLDKILKTCLPNVGQLIEMYNTTGVTDIRAFLKVFEKYGHDVQSLTQNNRKQITEIIMTNLNNMEPEYYEKTDRLEYPHLERELLGQRGSGILSDEFLKHPALMEYRIKFANFPHIYHKYLRMVKKLDNGQIWLALMNPNNTPEDIKRVVQHYNIINLFKEIMNELQFSYQNLLKKTPPNPNLLDDYSDNPIDSIRELRPDKRDQIVWFQFFKNSYPDRTEKNRLYRSKWIGCQHEYDSLYKKFEDPDDPFPLGKRYTRITPHGGVVCGFCGDTLEDDSDIIDQGYDVRGQKINTYDNDALLRVTTNIDLFLKKDKSEIVRSGEKMVEQWMEIAEKKLSKRQLKAIKYEILKTYEEIILDNKFYNGLQQNPNKLMKANDREFGKFLVSQYNIDKPSAFPTFLFLQKLFQLFYSISSIYEIIIQRIANFMVVLNWHLVQEDPVYLNPVNLMNSYNLEEIGKIFFQYNLSGKAQIISLKGEGKEDSFFDFFNERASKQYPQKDMSMSEYQKFLKAEYQKYRTKLLYTKDVQGQIFNGANPLEHEVMRIFGEYQQSQGKSDVREHLNTNFVKYWKEWISERETEVKNIEENAKVNQISEKDLLNKVSPSNRPLFDRYLAQRKFLLMQQLEQVYLDLVNDNIYSIRTDKNIDGGSEQVIMKKMYILNKMNCDDWTNMNELGLIGLDEETQRVDLIIRLKEEISTIQSQITAGGTDDRPYREFTGGELIPDLGPRPYSIYRTRYVPPDLVKREGSVEFRIINEPVEIRELVKIDEKSIPNRTKLFRDLSFLGKIDKVVNQLGTISYLKDLGEFNKHIYRVVNGQLNGTTQCNTVGTVEHPYPTSKEFEAMYPDAIKNQYMNSKMQLVNLKKYILSYVRHHIYLMARITERKQMIQYGLNNYMHLFNYDDFNSAFERFNEEEDDDLGPIITNDEIEDLVVQTIPDYEKHAAVNELLQSILLTDLVRHLRQVRTRAGKFVRGKKRKKGDEPNAAEIFTEFVQIVFAEIVEQEEVSNVNFEHLKINQMFMNKIMWDKMEKAEKRGELEWKILRHNLNIQEFELEIGATGEVPAEDTGEQGEQPEEYDELDMENDEDDYNDNDFDNI